MKLQVMIKNVYGNQTIYPVCDVSKQLCKINGTKTFTNTIIQTVRLLGWTIEQVTETVII